MKKNQTIILLVVVVFFVSVFLITKHVFRSENRTGECKSEVLTQNSVLGRKGEIVTACP